MSAVSARTAPAPLRPTRPILVATAAATAGVACATVRGDSVRGLMFACVAALLVWLAALDLDHRLLPNRIVLPAAAAVLLAQTALSPGRAAAFVAAAVVAAGFFLAFALAKPGALGMGDVKLAFLLGAAFGRGVIPVLVIGCLAASLFAAGVLVAHGKSAVGRTIAFAPFLALGALAAVFGGIA